MSRKNPFNEDEGYRRLVSSFAEFVWQHKHMAKPNDDESLLALCLKWRNHMIPESGESTAMCFALAVPLCEFLQQVLAIPVKLIHGEVGEWVHYWIELPDGRIIDPTGDQFNWVPGALKMPKVYLGYIPPYYLKLREAA